MYEKVIEKTMQEAVTREIGKVSVMVASHNEDSIRFCVKKWVSLSGVELQIDLKADQRQSKYSKFVNEILK